MRMKSPKPSRNLFITSQLFFLDSWLHLLVLVTVLTLWWLCLVVFTRIPECGWQCSGCVLTNSIQQMIQTPLSQPQPALTRRMCSSWLRDWLLRPGKWPPLQLYQVTLENKCHEHFLSSRAILFPTNSFSFHISVSHDISPLCCACANSFFKIRRLLRIM